MINKILPALILTVAALTTLCATAADESLPMIGAQVFIEPGRLHGGPVFDKVYGKIWVQMEISRFIYAYALRYERGNIKRGYI